MGAAKFLSFRFADRLFELDPKKIVIIGDWFNNSQKVCLGPILEDLSDFESCH